MNSQTPFDVPDSTTLRSLLEGIAQQHPELPAVLDSDRPSLSFAGLLLALQRIRKLAQDAGLRQGERVAVCHERPADMAIWLAALSDGLECIPLPRTLSIEDLSSLTGNLKPRAVLVNSGIIPWAANERQDEEIKVLQIADQGTNQWKWRLIGKVRDQATVWERATEEDSIALILMTSGSTASPKLVPVLHRAISLTITESARILALQAGERCLNFMPLSHVHGLVSGAFLPWVAGCCSVMPGVFRADDFLEWLARFEPNWFSTSPTIFADILRRSQTKGLPLNHPALRFVRCGSAALHETRAREIESAFQVPLLEAYGMSETLQIAGVPFAQPRPGSVGRSLILEIGIFDPQGRRLSPPDQGEILLKGPSLMPGYLGGAEPRDGFVGEWFKTGDLGYLDADGFLFVTGRVREVIISGGLNISPGEIEACLSAHPNVSECCVFGLPHPTLGESLGAAVVPNGAAGDLPDDLQQYMRRQLPLARIPKRIFALDCLPLLGNGKVDRESVVQQCVTLIESSSSEHLIDPLEAWLQTQFRQILQLDCVSAEDDFFALGGSSLDAMELLVRFRELLGVTLHPPLFLDTPTVRSLAQTFRKNYPEEIVPVAEPSADQPASPPAQTPTEAMHLTFSESLPEFAGALPAFTTATASPVFILSAPRCGSTLLRVMLAGHPQVFAPPEMRLLAFRHMGQWMAAHSGRFTFFREGLLRALMTAFEWQLQRARSWLENAAEEELPVEQVYAALQAALGDRLIIDKTPLYALSLEVLSSITSRFTRPRFVVLWRNPVAMKRSYTDSRMDQLWMHPTDSTPGQLAELIWYRCYANIDHFLETVDPARVFGMHFETLVTRPQECAESLCEFLEIPMDPEVLNPYGDHGQRMTEGVELGSPMIGDPRFFDHKSINPERAAGGLEIPEGVDLSEAVRCLARGGRLRIARPIDTDVHGRSGAFPSTAADEEVVRRSAKCRHTGHW